MSDSPLFSIIMPVYNRLDLARTAIESVSGQSDRNFEFVVVDDGSEDRVREELTSLSRKHGFTLLCQENAGPGAARNRGAREARGEYLVFLDSDDLLYPWALKIYRQVVEEWDRPSLIGADYFPFACLHPPEISEGALRLERFPDFLACSHGESSLGSGCQIVKKNVFERAGGFTDRSINCEDHDFVMRISTEPGFVRISSPQTVAIRVHTDSVTSVTQKTVEGIEYLLEREREGRYPGGRERERERRRILSKHVRPVTLACLKAGDAPKAWSLYRETFAWNVKLRNWKYLLGFPLMALFVTKSN